MALFGDVAIVILEVYLLSLGTAFEAESSTDGVTDKPQNWTRVIKIVNFDTIKFETGFVTEDKENTQDVTEYRVQFLFDHSKLSDTTEWGKLARGFQPFVRRLAQTTNVTNYGYSIGIFKEVPHWWQRWNSFSVPIYLSVRMQVFGNGSSREHYTKNILNLLGEHIAVNFNGKPITINFKLFNGSYNIETKISLFSDEESGDCCFPNNKSVSQKEVRILSQQLVFYEMSCPYLRLTEEEGYKLVDGGIRLILDGVGHTSNIVKETFTFHGDDTITICADVYNKYLKEYLKNPIGSSKWTVIVIFLSVSLLCLFLTFLTYCMFPSLRTIPAKNNMGLILCLFMEQMLYINGFLRTENKLLCQIIGVSLHYFWLATILWMNVCCFHVFKGFVLSKTMSSGRTGSCSNMFQYFLYANVVPVIIVSAVTTTNLILSEGQDSGYGGTLCFLSTVLLNGLTIVLPLCAVLLSNFVFFAATIYTINQTKQIRRNTGGERKNLWIYIKLSSITGLFWVVAILSEAVKGEALEYISIVLNSSQGAFLFVSYCCNKRILRLWKDRLTGRREHAGYGTSETSRSTRTKGTELTECSTANDNIR